MSCCVCLVADPLRCASVCAPNSPLPLQIADPAKLDAIFVPIGGGGLIAGIAAYVKALHPHIQVTAGHTRAGAQVQQMAWRLFIGSHEIEPGLSHKCLLVCRSTAQDLHLITQAWTTCRVTSDTCEVPSMVSVWLLSLCCVCR
jgi:hypothetical protein